MIQLLEVGLSNFRDFYGVLADVYCQRTFPVYLALCVRWLYRRYGNIFGSTVFHGCIDMSMGIFG